MNDVTEQFRAAISAAGLTAPETVVFDETIHRFSSNGKPSDNAGWYVLFSDPIAGGTFGCHRAKFKMNWREDRHRDMSLHDQALYRSKMKAVKLARETEDERRRSEARSEAERIWKSAGPAPADHAYLKAKGVESHGLRVDADGRLVLRMSDGLQLHSLQFIAPDGAKRFLTNGRKKGCYFPIGIPNGTLCIAEGYATGATIHEATGHAVAVAFDSGNLLPVTRSMSDRYPDLRLIVCGDDDINTPGNPGMKAARAAAESVHASLAIPDFGNHRPDRYTDFNDLSQLAGSETVRSCIDRAETISWPEPRPLPDVLPSVEPFTMDLLPRAFAEWVGDVSDRMQAPPDYAAVGLMVALGAVVGRQLTIRPKATDDWLVVPNLWGAIIGRPGVMKSPSLEEAIRPLNKLESKARDEHVEALTDFEANQMVSEAKVRNAKSELLVALKKGQDAHAIARTAIESTDGQPDRRRYLLHDATVEKLGEILAGNPRGVLVFRDELTGWLRGLDREERGSDRAFFLESWNGNSRFSYDRIGRGSLDIEAACVSILGGIQPGPLSTYMHRTAKGGADDDGLVQRIQLLVWPDVPRTWINVDRAPNEDARNQAYRVFERLDAIDPLKIGAETPEGELPFLRFSGDAQEAYTEWQTGLELRIRQGDLPPILEAHLSKYRSLVPSLALLIFLADGKTGAVDLDSLVRALAWSEFLESHILRVYAHVITSSITAADAIGIKIKNGDLSTEFSASQVQQKGWSDLSNGKVIGDALDILTEHDWLRVMHDQNTGGRPKTRYLVNPGLVG